jgi:hypothetical protein
MPNSLDVDVNHIIKYFVDLIKPEEDKNVYSKTSKSVAPVWGYFRVNIGLF